MDYNYPFTSIDEQTKRIVFNKDQGERMRPDGSI